MNNPFHHSEVGQPLQKMPPGSIASEAGAVKHSEIKVVGPNASAPKELCGALSEQMSGAASCPHAWGEAHHGTRFDGDPRDRGQ
jgi:hypothetical protein